MMDGSVVKLPKCSDCFGLAHNLPVLGQPTKDIVPCSSRTTQKCPLNKKALMYIHGNSPLETGVWSITVYNSTTSMSGPVLNKPHDLIHVGFQWLQVLGNKLSPWVRSPFIQVNKVPSVDPYRKATLDQEATSDSW